MPKQKHIDGQCNKRSFFNREVLALKMIGRYTLSLCFGGSIIHDCSEAWMVILWRQTFRGLTCISVCPTLFTTLFFYVCMCVYLFICLFVVIIFVLFIYFKLFFHLFYMYLFVCLFYVCIYVFIGFIYFIDCFLIYFCFI